MLSSSKGIANASKGHRNDSASGKVGELSCNQPWIASELIQVADLTIRCRGLGCTILRSCPIRRSPIRKFPQGLLSMVQPKEFRTCPAMFNWSPSVSHFVALNRGILTLVLTIATWRLELPCLIIQTTIVKYFYTDACSGNPFEEMWAIPSWITVDSC